MRLYGSEKLSHVTDDCDVSGCLYQGAPSKHGVSQDPRSKAAARRHIARNARREGRLACQERE